MSTAAVLLAAGGGTRFAGAGHKLLAQAAGRALVEHALDAALDSGCDEVVVVHGAVDLSGLVGDRATLLDNPRWSEGLATSLAVALDWCRAQGHCAAVVGLGDMPRVPASAWRALAAAGAEVAVASFDGERRPPVRLAANVWSQVPREGDAGARELWKRPGTEIVPCEGSPLDVDTTGDLDALRLDEER